MWCGAWINFEPGDATPAAASLLEAIRQVWSGSSSLQTLATTFHLHEAPEGIALPYAVVSGVTTEITTTTGETEVDSATLQILLVTDAATAAEAAIQAFRAAYQEADLNLGSRRMHCLVDRRHGPGRHPDRAAGGGKKAWFGIIELSVMHNKL